MLYWLIALGVVLVGLFVWAVVHVGKRGDTRLEDAIRWMAQRDYRRKMELWREYEQHRREVHHVLHVATAKGGR